jgi:hypothetical protein
MNISTGPFRRRFSKAFIKMCVKDISKPYSGPSPEGIVTDGFFKTLFVANIKTTRHAQAYEDDGAINILF